LWKKEEYSSHSLNSKRHLDSESLKSNYNSLKTQDLTKFQEAKNFSKKGTRKNNYLKLASFLLHKYQHGSKDMNFNENNFESANEVEGDIINSDEKEKNELEILNCYLQKHLAGFDCAPSGFYDLQNADENKNGEEEVQDMLNLNDNTKPYNSYFSLKNKLIKEINTKQASTEEEKNFQEENSLSKKKSKEEDEEEDFDVEFLIEEKDLSNGKTGEDYNEDKKMKEFEDYIENELNPSSRSLYSSQPDTQSSSHSKDNQFDELDLYQQSLDQFGNERVFNYYKNIHQIISEQSNSQTSSGFFNHIYSFQAFLSQIIINPIQKLQNSTGKVFLSIMDRKCKLHLQFKLLSSIFLMRDGFVINNFAESLYQNVNYTVRVMFSFRLRNNII
jgi:hypothetical protein